VTITRGECKARLLEAASALGNDDKLSGRPRRSEQHGALYIATLAARSCALEGISPTHLERWKGELLSAYEQAYREGVECRAISLDRQASAQRARAGSHVDGPAGVERVLQGRGVVQRTR
jgi:hypothetical protein